VQLPVLERLSGGGAVLVTPALVGAALALPCSHPIAGSELMNSYRWLGDLHARALRRIGISAATIPPADLTRASVSRGDEVGWACFGALSPWEVVGHDRRKLVGLAQARRSTGTVLVAGTLVGAVDWIALAAAVGGSEADAVRLARFTTNCEAELGRQLPSPAFAAVLSEALAGRASGMPSESENKPVPGTRPCRAANLPPVR
jgi:lipoate-protein ligase A